MPRSLGFTGLLALALLAAGCSCGEQGVAQDLVLLGKPRAILDTGEVAVITASAADTKLEPGKGTIRLQSTAGSFKDGVDLVLDADGLAKADFSCTLATDPGCVGTVTITGTWTAGGATATGEIKIAILVEPLRGACEPGFERPADIVTSTPADIQLVLPPAVSERSVLTSGSNEIGVAFYDPTNTFGGFAISRPPIGFGIDEEALGRGAIGSLGAISNPLLQTFRTWDLYSGSVRATYEVDSTVDLKTAINTLATAFNSGTAVTGGFSNMAGATGPFKVIITYVRRVARTVVVLTITPSARYDDPQSGRMDNVAGGTSLGQADDTTSAVGNVPCEFVTGGSKEKIDFLWVVDDSCSMASSQDAVFTAGSVFASRLTSAGLDWRVSATTTGYYPMLFNGSIRPWTSNPSEMLTWFRAGTPAWFGVTGDGTESGFLGLTSFLARLPKPGSMLVPGPVRADAQLQVIFLTDAPDQSSLTPQETLDAVRSTLAPNQVVMMHGIRCPSNESCGDADVLGADVYEQLIQATEGVVGDIRVFNVANPTVIERARQGETMAAILRSAVAGAGIKLTGGFPIGSTVKVAISNTVGPCTRTDVPRSPADGWDLDPSTGRMLVYGACSPSPGATMAVSYRTFSDTTPETVMMGPRDAGMMVTGDAGILLATSRPVLFRGINDSVAVTARLQGVSPNLGQPLDISTTAGAFVTSLDGGTSTMVTATTGPAGVVNLTLVETGASGTATITATHVASGFTAQTDVEIRQLQQVSHVSTSCGSSANCTLLGVRGSGYNEVAQVVFRVTDAMGRPAIGVPVTFSSSLPPGTTLSPSAVSNGLGEVTASVQSGTALGTFTIQATVIPGLVEGSSPTLAIRGAKPANKQFRLFCSTVNLPAWKSPNPPLALTSNCTVRVVDRNNNLVGTGIQVSLKVEAGTVPNNVPTAPFMNNNANEGLGTFTFDTVGGTWPPADTTPFAASPTQFPFPRLAEPSRVAGSRVRNPRDGLITVLAYVVGEEHFDDNNGNGVYDLGEQFVDQGEPFVDSNDNNVWDPGEIMIPELVNGVDNGVWDGPNGVYDRNKIIWTETKLVMTNNAEPGVGTIGGTNPGLCPAGIPKGGSVDFPVFLPDLNLNRIPAGSSMTVSRLGSRGTVSLVSTTLLDGYGFDFDRILVNSADPTLACVAGDVGPPVVLPTPRCEWRSVFGAWGGGQVSTLRVTGTATSDVTPCGDEPGLAVEATVLGSPVQTIPISFGVQ